MKTAVEYLVEQLFPKALSQEQYYHVEQAKEMEREQKIDMLKSFLHDLQMGEDVEDVEAWFKQYEKQQEQVKKELTSEEIPESFFKPVLCEPIWNVTNRTTKQQEQ
jgi:hypothetical protein